jgi:hypothetical protein
MSTDLSVDLCKIRLFFKFSLEDGSPLQGDIHRGGILIPLLDQQPGVLPQPWLPEKRELPTQFFAEEQETQLSPV